MKTAFLHGTIDEEIYKEIPKLTNDVIAKLMEINRRMDDMVNLLCNSCINGDGQKVLCLNKSIYGLKQAAKQWYVKLSAILSRHGLQQSTSDPCLFIGKTNHGDDAYVVVYIDDLIIASKSNIACNEIVKAMRKSFDLSSVSNVHYFLGMKIHRDREAGSLAISQHAYVDKILQRFNLSTSHRNIPMEHGIQLERASDDEMNEA